MEGVSKMDKKENAKSGRSLSLAFIHAIIILGIALGFLMVVLLVLGFVLGIMWVMTEFSIIIGLLLFIAIMLLVVTILNYYFKQEGD